MNLTNLDADTLEERIRKASGILTVDMNCNMGKSKADFYIFCYFICKKWECLIFAISIKNE